VLPLEEVEMQHIRYALSRLSGNYTQAAKALGISLSTLKRKLKMND
jgi:transcriptional regulator with PAS, ATPase and Fis domain